MPGAFELPSPLVDRVVGLALEEDLASGDLTTEACIDADATRVGARPGPLGARRLRRSGLRARLLSASTPRSSLEMHAPEGARVAANARLWTVRGRARAILMGERVALNLVQRMSGVATQARALRRRRPARDAGRASPTRARRRRVCARSSATRCASAAVTTIATISAPRSSSRTTTSRPAAGFARPSSGHAPPLRTPRRSSARSTRSISSTRRSRPARTSSFSTTCRRRRSRGRRAIAGTGAPRGLGRHHARARRRAVARGRRRDLGRRADPLGARG